MSKISSLPVQLALAAALTAGAGNALATCKSGCGSTPTEPTTPTQPTQPAQPTVNNNDAAANANAAAAAKAAAEAAAIAKAQQEQAQKQAQEQAQRQAQNQEQAQLNQQKNQQTAQQALTLNQNYERMRAATALSVGSGSLAFDGNCNYASNIVLGLSIVDEGAATVTIPLGADQIKGCPKLKADFSTINAGFAPDAPPAVMLLGIKTAGALSTDVEKSWTSIVAPADDVAAKRVNLELELLARAKPPIIGGSPMTMNFGAFSGAAAGQQAAPATPAAFPPCAGKWVYKAPNWSCEKG